MSSSDKAGDRMARWQQTASAKARLAVANTTSAFGFALRRLRVRTALRHHHVPWRRFAVVSIALIILAAAYFDPVFGAHIVDNSSLVTRFGRAITDYGKSGWYLIPLAVFLIWTAFVDWRRYSRRARLLLFNRTAAAWYAFVAIGGSGLIVTFLKQAIGRARPLHFAEHGTFYFDSWAFDASYAGFPSGHATTVGAVCFCVAVLFPRLRLLAIIVALYFGFSRSVVGAHYPSDVVAGLLLGGWFAYFTAIRFGKAGLVFNLPETGMPHRRQSFHLLGRRHRRRLSNWSNAADRRLHALARKPYRAPPN
ncbi:MAG: phosphatase PAP2 family protein [Alphaproteobacteria bacterium]|nr:phosphatase PAP2 family protein [Alphaproteobacteria bacterium]